MIALLESNRCVIIESTFHSPDMTWWLISLLGAGGAFLGTFLMYFIQTTVRSCWIRCRLTLEVEPLQAQHCTIRVCNGSGSLITNAIGYISLDNVAGKSKKYEQFRTYLPVDSTRIQEDRLCWSLNSSKGNPYEVSIKPKEKQSLAIYKIINLSIIGIVGEDIEIPSEVGYATNYGHNEVGKGSRAFLQKESYKGLIKIVCDQTRAKTFKITINPNDKENPLKIG